MIRAYIAAGDGPGCLFAKKNDGGAWPERIYRLAKGQSQ
jgi:hypothetical protein